MAQSHHYSRRLEEPLRSEWAKTFALREISLLGDDSVHRSYVPKRPQRWSGHSDVDGTWKHFNCPLAVRWRHILLKVALLSLNQAWYVGREFLAHTGQTALQWLSIQDFGRTRRWASRMEYDDTLKDLVTINPYNWSHFSQKPLYSSLFLAILPVFSLNNKWLTLGLCHSLYSSENGFNLLREWVGLRHASERWRGRTGNVLNVACLLASVTCRPVAWMGKTLSEAVRVGKRGRRKWGQRRDGEWVSSLRWWCKANWG